MKVFNRCIVGILPIFPKSFVWLFSRRYVAGISIDHAVEKTKMLNDSGCSATMDVLGEDIIALEEATAAKKECIGVLDAIKSHQLNSALSLKLSQMGLHLNKEQCYMNLVEIVAHAKKLDIFVRIDMEDSTCTDDTLELYRRIRKKFKNTGTVIQACLKRSQGDVKRLIDEGIANLRICKGIYDESPEIAYKDKKQIRENFMEITQMMLDANCYIGIATHDKILVQQSLEYIHQKKINTSQYEFQMLLGVTEKLRKDIVSQGYNLRVYVPYGEQWYAYCMRRLKENPQVAGHIVKNLFIR